MHWNDVRYIGDGVYVSYDGFQFKLESEQDGIEQVVFLPVEVLASLNRYAEQKLGVKE